MSREYYELGLPMIEKAGVAHKIDFRQGPALPLLDELLQDVRLPHFWPTLFHHYYYSFTKSNLISSMHVSQT